LRKENEAFYSEKDGKPTVSLLSFHSKLGARQMWLMSQTKADAKMEGGYASFSTATCDTS